MDHVVIVNAFFGVEFAGMPAYFYVVNASELERCQITSNISNKLAQSSIDLEMELELIPSFQASLSLLKGLAQVGVKVEFMVFLELNSTFQSPEPFPGLSSEYLDESSLWRGGDCRLPHFMEYNCNAGYGEVNISIPLSVNVPAIGNETSELDVASSAARSSYSLFSGCVATAYDAEIILLVAIDTVSSLSDKKKEALQTILMWTLGMTDIEPDFVNITSVSSVTGEISITLSVPPSLGELYPNASDFESEVYRRARNESFAIASATDTGKKEAPEVVTNYVYDMPEKKSKVKADYDDIDDLENDDFDHDLSDEDEEDEDEFNFELRPLVSEDEDEMAYFSHRMGGSDFKLLRRHVLHPHGRIRSIWDTVALVLIIWVLIIVPFELCFNMNDSLRRRILHFDLFVDAMFVVDIAFNFNTAVEDDGKLHFSLPSIFRHYTRGWFVPEVLWTLPFYAIFEAHDSEAYGSGGSPTNPLFRFASRSAWFYPTVRCLRLMRVVGLPRLQRRLEHSLLISSRVSSLGSFLFVVLALSHVFSCLFAYLAFNDEDQLEFAIYSRVLQDSELKTRYIAAFYWSMMTMTTVGYGDITVKTNAGRLFSLAAMIVGAGVFAYGITNVVSLFQQLYENDTAYRRDMDQINDFMQARMLPRALRDKVRANTFHWRKAARGENKERDRAIVERMASLIRTKVADRFCEEMMPRKMPFLAGCSAEFIHDLYLRMRVQCYLPGEDIISQGDYGSEMFFLFAGHAQVLLGITKVALFGPNSCFGEFSIANPRKPRLATIQALDFCETHCIDREQILRILLRHPITLRSARQLATLRSRKALTLIYETGGKSRTLLQGLAMVWRAEGVQGVLPAGVLPDSLPFLQEFAVTHSMVRGNSVASSVFVPQFQLQQLHPQNLDPAQVSQLQQYNATMGPNTGTTTAPLTSSLTGSARRQSIVVDPTSSRRQSLVVDPTIALATTSGTPSHHQRGRVTKLPKIIPDGPSASDLPLKERDAVSARKVVNALAGGRPKLTRSGSTTNLRMGIPLAVLPPVAAAPPPPQDDRLEQLLTEIRNVASRQNVLEQQLKAMLESAYPGPETQSSKLDSGIIAYEKGRFDEQHWIDRQHAPPLTRDRSARHIDRKIHRDGADT
ncbi:Potassium voltage-gated channel subfamily H member 7 [Phytophthora ramorum]|uniref:Potassium voltage-gated channel subfamily H member 7 n=1 Tax=Phytophthora ramorum TaxID=164328 RepID=UPI0030976DD7|nr:Potassium voltage-gated channel subfamily H member 7 [Phytophthora ramorum]